MRKIQADLNAFKVILSNVTVEMKLAKVKLRF